MADTKEALPVVVHYEVCGLEFVGNADHTAAIAELRAEVERARAECDAIAELNHAQWLALENVRLLAARNRKEEWGQHMLRFCEEAGNSCSAIHRSAARAGASGGASPKSAEGD